jgi:Bacterial Ig-like domain (group 3)/Right handed beta helix region
MRYSLNVWARSVVLSSLVLLSSELARPQRTIHVPTDVPTIQQAINQAHNGDMVLVAPGTYDENIDFLGKSIEVTSEGGSNAGASHTIIMGADGATVSFQSNEPSGAILKGFTITHQSPGGQTRPGEGIFISGASPTISDDLVTRNDGCGISITGPSSSPAISGNDISWNFAGATSANPRCGTLQYPLTDGIGIGIFDAGSVAILNNTIQGNNTVSLVNTCGGGIWALGATKLTIANNAISRNTNVQEGAYSSSAGGGGGGGIFVAGIGDLALIQNLVYSNVVLGGGATPGIGVGSANLESQQMSGNLTIINNTVVGNLGPVKSAEQLSISEYPVQSTVENNIFESTDNGIAIYCSQGANVGFSYNDVIGSGSIHSCGGSNNFSAAPLFVDSSVGNFHLSATSPLVTLGDPKAANLPATDFDGLPRIVNGDISLGVYEYQPVTAKSPVLTSSANPSYVGQTVTFTATLDTSSTRLPVTGTMTFRDGTNVLGTVSVGTAGTAALSLSSLSAGTHSIYAIYSGDSDLPPATTNTLSQTVSTFATTVDLTASVEKVSFGQNVALSAQVASPGSSALVTGGVVFYEGLNSLGVAEVVDGIAKFTTNSLTAGAHTIVAKFIQNQTYSASTSNAVTITVLSDFTISATPTSQNIDAGRSAQFGISIASASGFNSPVALSCSGLPPGASCTFSPASLVSGTGTSQLVIEFPASGTSASSRPTRHGLWTFGTAAPILGALLFLPWEWRRRFTFSLLLLAVSVAVTSCGTPQLLSIGSPQTYSISVTGTGTGVNGPIIHSTTVTLRTQSNF